MSEINTSPTFNMLERLAMLNDYLNTYEGTRNDTRQALEAQQQALIDSVLTPEILAQVDAIKAEFAPKFEALNNDQNYQRAKNEADTLTEAIKQQVISAGATIKGSVLQAVFIKGRVTFDTKALEGYAAAHPEIEKFKKVGEPSVTIRKVAGL
jgi:hypothetical protein